MRKQQVSLNLNLYLIVMNFNFENFILKNFLNLKKGTKPRNQLECLENNDDNNLCDTYAPDLVSCYNYQKSDLFKDFSCFAKVGQSVTLQSTNIQCEHPGKDLKVYIKGTCYIEITLYYNGAQPDWFERNSTLFSVIVIVVLVLAILAAFWNQCVRKRF